MCKSSDGEIRCEHCHAVDSSVTYNESIKAMLCSDCDEQVEETKP